MELESQLVYFSGHVQGVGFRYNTSEVAKQFPVTGYVRNLADGRVEMLAEGDPTTVQKFVDAVCHRMAQFIDTHSVERRAIESPDHEGFTISHTYG